MRVSLLIDVNEISTGLQRHKIKRNLFMNARVRQYTAKTQQNKG